MRESTELRATRMTFVAEIEARRIVERFRAPHDA